MGETPTSEYDALPGLACREMVELITSYLEGRLPPGDRYRFERHLSRCPNCTAYLIQMQATIAASGKLSEDDLQPETKEELLTLFRGWKAG